MLERIEEIQGIGLLHQANCRPFGFKKATLIYADNGRGKTTLATVFHSVSTKNDGLIVGMKTVDGSLDPKVVLQFQSGHKVKFENGNWSEQRPELLVFDSDFVTSNVHSGGIISTDHRKNLLEFALGEGAVQARKDLDNSTNASRVATEEVRNYERQLSGYHSGLTLDQFDKLPQPANDVDLQISELEKRIKSANDIANLHARPLPDFINLPSFDFDGVFEVLGQSLANIHSNAEAIFAQHVQHLGGKGAETWLSQGQQYTNGEKCPFCNQDISNNELIRAYQTHFNESYQALTGRIDALIEAVSTSTDARVIELLTRNVQLAATRAMAWADQVQTAPIVFDSTSAQVSLSEIRENVLALLRSKAASPASPLGIPQDSQKIKGLWNVFLQTLHAVNELIEAGRQVISTYRNGLSNENVADLRRQRELLQATKRRHDSEVISLFTDLSNSRLAASAAEAAMRTARNNLNNFMASTLGQYQVAINDLLKKFGAAFTIKDLSANFRGNAPRSEFGIELRGKSVPLEGGPPSFKTALSEGDKRTLAFAFFLASTFADQKLSDKVVIIDDPMSSFDRNRRKQTCTLLKKLHNEAEQLIVLAHDYHFLRELRDELSRENGGALIMPIQMSVAPNLYTSFAQLDIDKECEGVYARHHRLLYDYAVGNGGDLQTVAKGIRPLLEGYLHRRFPGLLPKDALFGNVVVLIRDSIAPSPLVHAKNLVDELNEINSYAGQFHHDTNPNADTVVVVDGELRSYVNRALSVIHKGMP